MVCIVLLLLSLLFLLLPATASCSPLEAPSVPAMYADDRTYPGFAGRLYAEAAGIDVALYHSITQAVVDRPDAAALFDLHTAQGKMIIADHNNQAFNALGSLRIGARARIVHPDGTVTHYVCTGVLQGRNTGQDLTDQHGRSLIGRAELIMYTCFDGWQNIRLVLWTPVPSNTPE